MIRMQLTVLQRKKVYRGTVVDLTVDTVAYPSGESSIREIVEHPGGSVIVPVFDDHSILLLRQYRHPLGQSIIEFPAGKLEQGEDPLECAKRELLEETGFSAMRWTPISGIHTTPGFCNELLHLFMAEQLIPDIQGPRLEPGEFTIEIFKSSLPDAMAMVQNNQITDAKTVIGIQFVHYHFFQDRNAK